MRCFGLAVGFCCCLFLNVCLGERVEAAPLKTGSEPSISLSAPTTVAVVVEELSVVSKSTVQATVGTNSTSGYKMSLTADSSETCMKHSTALMENCTDILATKKFSSLASSTTTLNSRYWGVSVDGGTTWSPVPAVTGTPLLLKNTPSAVTSEKTDITVGLNADIDMEVGTYSGDIVVTAVTNAIPAPTVTSLSPNYGVATGLRPTYGVAGSTVTIRGTGLDSTYELTVGGVNCASANIVSATELTCVLPSDSAIQSGDVLDISIKTWGGNVMLPGVLTYDTLWNIYRREMLAVEDYVADVIYAEANSLAEPERIGTALSSATAVTILGINYGQDWYYINSADLLSAIPGADVSHAPYIVKYDTNTAGAVMSVPGEVVDGTIIHTFNYSGEGGLVIDGLLSAVTANSSKTQTQWGEFVLRDLGTSGITYDAVDGGLVLGDDIGELSVDLDKPVGERYTIGFTIKGVVPQTNSSDGHPRTIIAISPANQNYLAWFGIKNGLLQIYSYYNGAAKSNITTDSTDPNAIPSAKDVGFQSIDLTKICNTAASSCSGEDYVYHDYSNQYMNIYVVAERKTGAETTYTKVYINGELVRTFSAGGGISGFGTLTLGDLRSGRNLKYIGKIYDFAFYSEVLSAEQILQNWEYARSSLP